MGHQGDRLARIGQEGFALLENRSRKAPPPSQYHYQQSYHTYHVCSDATPRYNRGLPPKEHVIAIPRNETQFYEGLPAKEHGIAIPRNETQFYGGQCVYQRTQIPIVKETVISSDEAAQMYGGVNVVQYQMRKPTSWP